MANSENTAVNELIARVSGGPTSSPLSDAYDPGANLDHAVTLKAGAPLLTAHPTSMPVAAPFETQPGMPTSYPVVPRAMIEPAHPAGSSVAPAVAAYGDPGTAQSWAMPAVSPAWTEPAPLNAPRERSPEHLIGTLRLSRRSDLQIVISKLVLPMTILLVAGMLIGGYVAFHGDGGLPRSPAAASASDHRPPVEPGRTATVAPPARATAAPAPAPAVETPAAPAPAPAVETPAGTTVASSPALIDVRIDSTPSGATVMLVDRGKTQYVGSTPVSAAVDPSREYDLVFTYPNKPTTLEHLDASTTRRVAVTLGTTASAAKPADSAPHHLETATAEPPPPTRKPARQAAEPASGEGTLKISSKPPCEIVIDGKPTGLVTPQTSIALRAGTHRVTLVNREKDIKKTVSVQISANTTEKIIEDFMK
jgi:PEGA domain